MRIMYSSIDYVLFESRCRMFGSLDINFEALEIIYLQGYPLDIQSFNVNFAIRTITINIIKHSRY